MRTMVLSLTVLTALSVAGCSGGSSGAQQGAQTAQSGSSAAATVPSSVSGTVGLKSPHELSDKAVLTIKLVDVSSSGGKPLANKTVSPISALPVQFTFDVKPGEIHPSDIYVINAEIVDGIRHYTMTLQAPVLTQKAPDHVDIRLMAVPTPGEKMFKEYKDVKARIGGMKMSKGTSLNKTVSRGWQVFRDKDSGQIRFVIELSDYVKGDYTKTEYAYKDSKPWVVVKTIKPSEKAKPSEIDRAGWNAQGELILKGKVVDGKTTTLDADTAAQLRKEAVSMFARARKSK
ncbi:MAG TPA: YbaY family lipoprotein [Oleiagrimonas sp.]|nr:YbaY family lipoprotein [Oleiagrimonas sp.]